MKNYRKKNIQPMRPYIIGEDLTGISVNKEDTPEEGGMIAINSNNNEDRWYVAKQFFQDNYEEAQSQVSRNELDRILDKYLDGEYWGDNTGQHCTFTGSKNKLINEIFAKFNPVDVPSVEEIEDIIMRKSNLDVEKINYLAKAIHDLLTGKNNAI